MALSFLLRDGGQEVDYEPIRLGPIDGDELDAGFHEVRDKGDVAGETIQPGDDQGSAIGTARKRAARGPGVVQEALLGWR